MLLVLALVLFLLFAGLGFLSHVLWLGLVASVVVLMLHMMRQGLSRGTPTSRLNVRLVAAARGFLDDVLESRAKKAKLEATPADAPATAAPAEIDDVLADDNLDDVVEAEVVEDAEVVAPTTPSKAIAPVAWTKAKAAKAEQLDKQGLPKTEIAKRLGVSRSTLYRHLTDHRKSAKAAVKK